MLGVFRCWEWDSDSGRKGALLLTGCGSPTPRTLSSHHPWSHNLPLGPGSCLLKQTHHIFQEPWNNYCRVNHVPNSPSTFMDPFRYNLWTTRLPSQSSPSLLPSAPINPCYTRIFLLFLFPFYTYRPSHWCFTINTQKSHLSLLIAGQLEQMTFKGSFQLNLIHDSMTSKRHFAFKNQWPICLQLYKCESLLHKGDKCPERSYWGVTGGPLPRVWLIPSAPGHQEGTLVVQSHPGHRWGCPAEGWGQQEGACIAFAHLPTNGEGIFVLHWAWDMNREPP